MEAARCWLGLCLVAMAMMSFSKGQTPAPEDDTPLGYHQEDGCKSTWENWGIWSECNGYCNQEGQRARYRNCKKPQASKCTSGYYTECPGKDMESGRCMGKCTQHNECQYGDEKGGWGEWACWSKCKNGVKIRYRVCNKPMPIGEHNFCYGSHEEKQQCTTHNTNPYPPSHNPNPNPYPPSHNPNPNPYPPSHNPNPYPPSPSHNPNPYPPSHNPNPYPPSHNPNNGYPSPACVHGQDIIFAVDSSGSIGRTDYTQMTNSLLHMIKAFDLDYSGSYDNNKVRTGIVLFSDYAYIVKHLNDYNVPKSLRYYDGPTNTAAGIESATKQMFQLYHGDRPNNANVLVILTDGQSSDTTKTLTAANYAKSLGIKIICVGIGNAVDSYELEHMATDSYKDVYYVNQFDQIPQEFDRLFKC